MNRKRPYKPGFIFVILIIICLVMISGSITGHFSGRLGFVNIILAPMQSGINAIGGLAFSVSQKRSTQQALESENEELRKQVDELNMQLSSMEQNLSDYNDLLELTQLSEKYPGYQMTAARIIGKDAGNWFNTFTINKGSIDGIKKDMNVVADQGLVGIVTQVGTTSSVVRSIIDDNSSVSAMITKNYDNCFVDGDLTLIDKGLLSVEMISNSTSLVDGDEVVTSYISEKYLPGILIGYISQIEQDDTGISYHAQLTPVVDFQHLSTVMVITKLRSELNEEQSVTAVGEDTSAGEESVSDESETEN